MKYKLVTILAVGLLAGPMAAQAAINIDEATIQILSTMCTEWFSLFVSPGSR